MVKTRGVYLGITADISEALYDDEFTLKSGDVMVLYTDGVIEAKDSSDELLNPKGLIDIITNNVERGVDGLKDAIINEALKWCNHKVDDDITLIVVKMK